LLAGVRGREARERARTALDAVGLSDRAGHRPSELSGGQQQRVAIARALVNDPAVVWADEPTGNLDSQSAEDILDLIAALNVTKRQTFVLVTHAPQVAERAHRVLWMRDGEIVREERPTRRSGPAPEVGTGVAAGPEAGPATCGAPQAGSAAPGTPEAGAAG
jgi:putative ABC transport system ATP-binding protein